jgi:hypothetical protein
MYIRYAYLPLSKVQSEAEAQVAAILSDIQSLLFWQPDLNLSSATYLQQLQDNGIIISNAFDPLKSQVAVTRLADWATTPDTIDTNTAIHIVNNSQFATTQSNVILSTGPVTARSAQSISTTAACTLNFKAYEQVVAADGVTIINNYASGWNDPRFKQPIIFCKGGYLFISASSSQLLIAGMNRRTNRWVPGIGVMQFQPVDQSYHDVRTYPMWCYMSMAALDCISVARKFDIATNSDVANTSASTDVVINRMQIKGPYVTDRYNLQPIKNTAVPQYTYNADLVRGRNVGRLKFHRRADISPTYDAGGDISSWSGVYMVSVGNNMDTIDLLLPVHSVASSYTTTDIHDPNYAYVDYYGKYILWASDISTAVKSNTKFLIKMG